VGRLTVNTINSVTSTTPFASFAAGYNGTIFNITPPRTVAFPAFNFGVLADNATVLHPTSVNNTSTLGSLNADGWTYQVAETGTYEITAVLSILYPIVTPAIFLAVGDASTTSPFLQTTSTGGAIAAIGEGNGVNSQATTITATGIVDVAAGTNVGLLVSQFDVPAPVSVDVLGASLVIKRLR